MGDVENEVPGNVVDPIEAILHRNRRARCRVWKFEGEGAWADPERLQALYRENHDEIKSLVFRVTGFEAHRRVIGVVHFVCQKRFNATCDFFVPREEFPGETIDLTPCTKDATRDYYLGELYAAGEHDHPIELGVRMQKASQASSVFEKIVHELEQRRPLVDIAVKYPKVWLSRAPSIKLTKELLDNSIQLERQAPDVYVLWGPTGIGKSRLARQICDELLQTGHVALPPYVKAPGNKWFCHYEHGQPLIIEEYSHHVTLTGHMREVLDLETMKMILDCHAFPGESKFGRKYIRPRYIFITSNEHWHDWWPMATQRDLEAIARRITYCWTASPCGILHKNEVCDCEPVPAAP